MDEFPHAILIEGGSNETRHSRAIAIMQKWFCDDPFAANKLEKGIFEDLITLEPEGDRDILTSDIEDLIARFMHKPFASTGKALIIPQGERMNEFAQNKLLKLLEEPPGRGIIIILAANAQRLLPTVRSRTMRIWLGYAKISHGMQMDEFRKLASVLIYGKGTLAEANQIISQYEGSSAVAVDFLNTFQLFLRMLVVSRYSPELLDGKEEKWFIETAAKVKELYSDRMRKNIMIAESARIAIERGSRIRYVLRGMALAMRME